MKPPLLDLDYEEWRTQARMERVRAMVVHWAEPGFGARGVYVLCIVKLALCVPGAAFFASLTPGIGGLGSISHWRSQPIVY
jgi:hypothetical protein